MMLDEHRNEKMVKLCETRDIVELTLLRQALTDAQIKCMDSPHSESAYDDLFVPAMGYADIYVFETDLQAAQKVVANLKNTREK